MSETRLTPMQQFALELLAKEKGAINPGYLGTQWYVHQTGRLPRAASRDTFGLTTAAYKTLRRLADLGLVTKHLNRAHSITIETYEFKKQS